MLLDSIAWRSIKLYLLALISKSSIGSISTNDVDCEKHYSDLTLRIWLWNSLAVQWLGLCCHCHRPGVQSPIRELRSSKLFSEVKKEKKRKENYVIDDLTRGPSKTPLKFGLVN